MIFVIDNLKYDTDHMELVSEKCKYIYSGNVFGYSMIYYGKDVKLWRSKKDNWLLTYKKDFEYIFAVHLTKDEAKKLLLRYDLETYEKIFGELGEA